MASATTTTIESATLPSATPTELHWANDLPQPLTPPQRLHLIGRTATFWWRVARIYASYKHTQLRALLLAATSLRPRPLAPSRQRAQQQREWRRERIEALWRAQHEHASREMYALCAHMRGFMVKAGQFLGMRADFLPEPFIRRLSRLHDSMPPMDAREAHRVVTSELGVSRVSDVFSAFDDVPLGAASIAQVHRARLRGGIGGGGGGTHAREVAVKVQYPGAEQLMLADLSSLLVLARMLQFELRFDLLSPVLELKRQIRREFDFVLEAASTERIRASLARSPDARARSVKIPRIGAATRRVLIMEYLDGVPMMRLDEELRRRGIRLSPRMRRRISRDMMHTVAACYGHMIMRDGFFQADAHAGNLLVMRGLRIGMVDFGQSKQLTPARRSQMARLVRAMAGERGVAEAFLALGVELEQPPRPAHRQWWQQQQRQGAIRAARDAAVTALAYSMFDTGPLPNGSSISPFAANNPLRTTPVKRMPPDLFFVLRVVQTLRGMATLGGNLDFVMSRVWAAIGDAPDGRA